uniref:Reverse transcriptase domain-containing protein n=1 Tax=Cannabis sativa TaxID=3483 RepID=A0A803Q2T5_CANSA
MLWNRNVDIKVLESLEYGFVCTVNDHEISSIWGLLAVYGTQMIEDKSGGRSFTHRDGAILQNFLLSTGSIDLGYSGCKYTWLNKRKNGGLVKERLDRVIVDTNWLTVCPEGGVRNLPITSSDHGAMVFDSIMCKTKGFRPFRFFEAWFEDPSCWEVIKEAWCRDNQENDRGSIGKSINRTQSALRWWSKNVFGDCDNKIKELEFELQTLQSKEVHETDEVAEEDILKNLGELWKRKESMWKQRSRELWLSKGDRNSSFFHASTMVRRKRNQIWNLKNSNGMLCSNVKEIGTILNEYFIDLFSSKGTLDPGLNHSFICLIPKARILAHRLKVVLDHLIAPTQSAFLPGRWIAESTLLTQEVVNVIKKKKGKGGLLAIKMDMNKAYDRLEWGFLKAVMERFGFSTHFINLVMCCVTTVSYSILLNGKPLKRFKPERGIRQGDPMSPYLFLLCNEVLSRLLSLEQDRAKEAIENKLDMSVISDWEAHSELDAIVRKFWWNGSLENQYMWAAKSWNSICQPKMLGGLGFRRFEDINHALLAKLAWMLACGINRPWCDIMKGKYFPRESFWSVQEKLTDSFLWRGILRARNTISKCVRHALREDVDVWWQPWIPWLDYVQFRELMESIRSKAPSMQSVADLMYRSTRKWNLGYLRYLFGSDMGTKIGGIQINVNASTDTLIWKNSLVGKFSVKGAYWVEQQERFGEKEDLWRWIWSSKVHPRLSLLLWRVCSNVLPTGDKFPSVEVNFCPLCHTAPESPLHLFTKCSIALALWFSSPWPIRIDRVMGTKCSTLENYVLECEHAKRKSRPRLEGKYGCAMVAMDMSSMEWWHGKLSVFSACFVVFVRREHFTVVDDLAKSARVCLADCQFSTGRISP